MALTQYTILQTETHATETTPEERQQIIQVGARLVVVDSPEIIDEHLATTDAILCAAFEVTPDVLSRTDNLRIVARLGTGVDNIDIAAATDHAVAVTNVPGFATQDVAEHTVALILGCAKRLTFLNDAARNGNWNVRSQVRLHTVDGQTLGLVGFGRIGRAVAKYASAMGMRVISYDPFVKPEDMLLAGQIEPVADLETLLRRSDFVSLHAPLVDSTAHIMSRREFDMMKHSAFLINCGRGALVDEEALVDAVNSGQIAGAGLDVLEDEPPTADNPVLSCPGIIITPHCSAHTDHALGILREEAVKSILQALRGQWPQNVVNPEVKESWMEKLATRTSR
jgi:D-3-phosphoglycerate dehydrogenase